MNDDLESFGKVVDKMKIFPAIDIEGGRCVRLKQGKISDLTIYGSNPVEMALKWEKEGARALHVVDLDGDLKGMEEIRRFSGKWQESFPYLWK